MTLQTAYEAASTRYDHAEQMYQRCGNSGVLLPRISLGLWKGFGGNRSLSECQDLLHTAFDHGIVHFDLANNYGPPYGSAEENFGRVMQTSFRPYRDELFIATKAGYDMWPGPYGNWGSRKYLMASLDQSLQRMKLDYVDVFYSHRYDPHTPLDETLQALADVVHQGKALYVGLSRWPVDVLPYAYKYLTEQHVRPLLYQGRLNLLDQSLKTDGILNELNRQHLGLVVFSPLAQGLLTDRYLNGIPSDSRMRTDVTLKESLLTPQLLEQLATWNAEARDLGLTLSQYSLRWVLNHPGVTSVIVGVSKKEQLLENLQVIHKL
ncbi:nADP-dependent oxidoreductase domain protein [Prevotella sp. CAG:891]|nr:nADP-dependent oxidoreductase domain protein [Prevotella sp. CAG:891]